MKTQTPVAGNRVAVVGGGLAGLAAAAGLCGRGFDVELFEARRQLGGRAGSFWDPTAERRVDFCRHVAMGCCTNLADFCRRTGVAERFERHRRLHFFGPSGLRYDVAAFGWLPAPLHLAPGLMRLGFLSLGQRWRILRAIVRLAREPVDDNRDPETAGHWLRRHGQSDRAIERFWSVVLESALGDTLDRVSLTAARKVFVDGFLGAWRAYELLVPRAPLVEIFDRPMAEWLAARGVKVHVGAPVDRVDGDAARARAVVRTGGTRREFDYFIIAVPWRKVRSLFPPAMLDALPGLADVDKLEAAPITAVHLWLDHPITELAHAVLVGRRAQWVFNHGEGYHEVVISASHELVGRGRRDVAAEICKELRAIWPASRSAKLLHHRVVTQPAAVFSPRPGTDRLRPTQHTPIANLALAGDWTATGWPATMESAVRSGHLAAETILHAHGAPDRLLVPDLPRSWLSRWLLGPG